MREKRINIFQKKKAPKKRIGLCLSGGSALGFAHIGVLQALEDLHIYPDEISGSSMGSLIGTLYAIGYKPKEMLELIKEEKLFKITKLMNFKPKFWEAGFVSHSLIRNLITELYPNNNSKDLKIPMNICVSNITTARSEIIKETDDIGLVVAASCSIPGIFNSVRMNENNYVDGGLLNNFPTQPLKESCDIIIGSDVIPHVSNKGELSSREVIRTSMKVLIHHNSQEGRELCDYLIEPKAIEKYNVFSYDAYKEIYDYGYRCVTQLVSKYPHFVEELSEKK